LENNGVKVWFEELNVIDGSVTDFIYGVEAEGEKEYVKCHVTDEYDDYFKDAPPGVYLVFEDETGTQ